MEEPIPPSKINVRLINNHNHVLIVLQDILDRLKRKQLSGRHIRIGKITPPFSL